MSKRVGSINLRSTGQRAMRLTLGSIDAETVGSQTQEFVGVIDELAADVVAFCSQAVTVFSQLDDTRPALTGRRTRRGWKADSSGLAKGCSNLE